jgi:hypothetical protein
LNQIARLVSRKAEQDVDSIDVSGVETNGMARLRGAVAVLKEIVGELWRPSHFTGPLKTQNKEIKHKTVVLEYESGELKTTYETESVGVRHILVRQDRVVL